MNWRNADDYQYTDALNGTGWAWEYLRRNSAYRRDWQSLDGSEQALGSVAIRWGLSVSPPDPAQTALELSDLLAFKAHAQVAKVITQDSDYLGQVELRVALGFDLDLPLPEQVDEALKFLQDRQQNQQTAGMPMRSIRSQKAAWLQGLRCLDALESGATTKAVVEVLFAGDRDSYRARLQQAFALHDKGYRELPGLPV